MFNEVCLVIGSYTLLEFSDYERSADFRFNVGWFLVGVMGINTGANISILFYKVGSVLRDIIRKKLEARKKLRELNMSKVQKYVEEGVEKKNADETRNNIDEEDEGQTPKKIDLKPISNNYVNVPPSEISPKIQSKKGSPKKKK